MQLYKQRDFGELVGDTFNFFKENGKNYFKNYLLLNGILIILIITLYIVGFKNIFAQAFSSNLNGNSYYFEQYFQENPAIFVLSGFGFLLLFTACTLIVYSYPVFYMKRYAETGTPNVSLNDIVDDLKKNAGKMIIFLFGMTFVLMPIIFGLMAVSVVLIFIFIGIILIFMMIPAIINLVNLTMFDYYSTQKGFFSSFGNAMRSQFSYPNANMGSPFWKYWGSTAIIILILWVISLMFNMVPFMLLSSSSLVVPNADNPQAMGNFYQSTMGTAYFIFMGIAMLVGFLLNNIIFVNAGLIYYDSRTDLHRNENMNEIENIGKSEI